MRGNDALLAARTLERTTMGRRGLFLRVAPGLLAACAFVLAGVWQLSKPPLWWDEGWTLSVARNLVEHGHYGRLVNGVPGPSGLQASFVVTVPVALGMHVFGVGIWQGRLWGVLCALAALILMYQLAKRLYNRSVATGTLFVLLLLPMHPQLHPLIMGRQVIAELAMFAYLLAGYLLLLLAVGRSSWLIVPAMVAWGVTIIAKAQVLPFWLLSLLVPLGLMLWLRQYRVAGLLGVAILGSYGMASGLVRIAGMLLPTRVGDVDPAFSSVHGLYNITALVFTSFNRWYALQMLLILGLPTLAGLGYETWQQLVKRTYAQLEPGVVVVRWALLVLAGSWCAWYLLLSVGVPRYLFPVTFLGSMFVSALLFDATGHFNVGMTVHRVAKMLRTRRVERPALGGLFAMLLVAATLPLTLLTLERYYLSHSDTSASQVAEFFNTQTDSDTLIETYESELHFLLNRRYHFPPDQLHVELNRRSLLGETVTIDYDPLAADPDYLVVGTFSRDNRLYEPVLATGAFRLHQRIGGYNIYARVR